jgi:drug/metabolite transporter (DMT)-like permease
MTTINDTDTSEPAGHWQAVWWLIAATAALGLSFPLQKMLAMQQHKLAPMAGSWFLTSWITCLRSLIAALALLLWKPNLLRELTPLERQQGALLGFIGGLGLMLQSNGLVYTNASTSAFLTQTYCVLLPIWDCLSRRTNPSWKQVGCTGLVLWGISILSGFDWRTLHMGRGEWETLGGALTSTVWIILVGQPRYAANRTMPVMLLMFLCFALCSAPVAAFAAPLWADLVQVVASPTVVIQLGVLSLFCTVFVYWCQNVWQPKLPVTEAGLIYCIESVWAASFSLFLPEILSHWTGVFYANESLTGALLAGGFLITGANVLLQMQWSPRTS